MLKRICGNCTYWSAEKLEHVKCKKCSMDKRSTERVHFMPRNMNCSLCEYEMISDISYVSQSIDHNPGIGLKLHHLPA